MGATLRQTAIYALIAAVSLGVMALKFGYPLEMVLNEPFEVLHMMFVAPRNN